MVLACLDIVNAVLFPSPKPSYGIDDFEGELIWVPKGLDPRGACPEDCVPCLLLLSPSARFFVLYLHSNAEDLGRCYKFCSLMRHFFHVNVLAVEYPGYGLCPGRAHEESVVENARVALRFLMEVLRWPLDGILVLGRSVGCGPALALAAEKAVYGLILVCPFASVKALCRDFLGTVADLIGERFPNLERIRHVQSPLLLIHGQRDSMVPFEHGRALFEACTTRKHLVSPEKMDHNAYLYADASYLVLPMLHFFGLPDYDFGEISVPAWAFDKRLSPFFFPAAEPQRAGNDGNHFCCARAEEEECAVPAKMRVRLVTAAVGHHRERLLRCVARAAEPCPPAGGAWRSMGGLRQDGPVPGTSPAKESQAEVASLPESERSTALSEGQREPALEDVEDEVLPVVASEVVVRTPTAHPQLRAKESRLHTPDDAETEPTVSLEGAVIRPPASSVRAGAKGEVLGEGARHVEFFGTVLSFGRWTDEPPVPPMDPSPTQVPRSCASGPRLASCMFGSSRPSLGWSREMKDLSEGWVLPAVVDESMQVGF